MKHQSDQGSSKNVGSLKDDILSGRAIFKIQVTSIGKEVNPVNTLTEGFFKNQNFIFSPSNKEIASVRSTKEFNQNINNNARIYNIEGGPKKTKRLVIK